MSFILDALKKSDAKRRAGEQPTLHAHLPGSTPKRVDNRLAWMRMALLGSLGAALLALGWAGWLVTRPAIDPDTAGQPERLVPFDERVAASPQTPPTSVERDEQADSLGRVGGTDGRSTDGRSTENEVSTNGASTARQVGSDQPGFDQAATVQTAGGSEDDSAVEGASTRPLPSAATTPAEAAGEDSEAEVARALGEIPLPGEVQTSEAVSEAASPDPMDDASWRPTEPDYLRHWELPLSVREALPPLTLNVHVYAPLSSDRFVLINGRRLQEGQAFYSGQLRLSEIRPEGALIDYAEYRFLLSQ